MFFWRCGLAWVWPVRVGVGWWAGWGGPGGRGRRAGPVGRVGGGPGWGVDGGARVRDRVGRLVGWNGPVGRDVYTVRKGVCMRGVKNALRNCVG